MSSTYFARIERTVYPLAPNSGHAEETKYSVVSEPGYACDIVAGAVPSRSLAVQIAAALAGVAPEEIETRTEYRYRTDRNAVLEHTVQPDGQTIRMAPVTSISVSEYETLVWDRPGCAGLAVALAERANGGRRNA